MAARSTMPNLAGRVINNGQYQLVRMLGSGTYGVVYEAHDVTTATSPYPFSSKTSRRRYAVKVLRKDALSPSAAQRVRREVAAHRKMSDHPNVVTMHTAFEDRDYIYIVLDYCPGGDLFGKISAEKLYFRKDELVKSAFLQILDAVDACHKRGVYHRDLKPENILTSKDGSKIYLTDFGLATGSKVSQTFGCGSSYYMSPECIGKEAGFLPYHNHTNDLWALGVILINMVTNRTPWARALTTDDCFCDFLLHEEYLREMLPISEGANRIFRRVFTYEPSERITIPALRKAIVELDTFFMNDAELARAGESARMAAAYCGVHVQPVGRAAATPKARATNVKVAPAAPPRAPAAKVADAAKAPPPTSAHQFVGGDLSEASEKSSASDASLSGTESDGPVTPSSRAQDPKLEIPELDISSASGPSLWRRMVRRSAPRGAVATTKA